MEATIASEDSVEFLGVRGAFVRAAVVERKGAVDHTIGILVVGDLVTFRFDDGRVERRSVRRMDISLFDAALAAPIADLPAELVPFARRGSGGEICVALRAFRQGERVRIVANRIEEMI